MADVPQRQERAELLEVRVVVHSGAVVPGRPLRAHLPHGLVAALAGLLVAAGALGVVATASRHHARRLTSRAVHAAGPAGAAAAYGYPMPCLSITVPPSHPSYARADFNHGEPCGRYTGFTTAILHRVNGAWHVVLDATSYSCPLPAIPLAVQAALGVCDTWPRAHSRPKRG